MAQLESPGPLPAPPLRVGATLTRAFSFYARNLPLLVVLGAVVFLPLVLYQLDYVRGMIDRPFESRGAWGGLLLLLLYFLTPLLLQVFVSLAVFQHLAGERVQPLRSVQRGLASVLPALGLAVLFALVLLGVGIAAGLPIALLRTTFRDAAWSGVLGSLIAVLSMVWVHCVFFVAPQALVVERLMPWTALGRSRRLTRGARWRIFAVILIVVVLFWLLGFGLRTVQADTTSWSDVRLNILMNMGLSALFLPFAAVCAAVVYHDLRRARDGVNVEELIRVFQ